MQNFIIRITQKNTNLLNDEKIGCFILPDTVSAEFAEKFINLAHQKEKLVLVCGNNALHFYKQVYQYYTTLKKKFQPFQQIYTKKFTIVFIQ